MLKSDEIKYIEEEIKKLFSSISHNFYQMVMREMQSIEEEYPGWDEDWLKSSIIELYYHISIYLEARGMLSLLKAFQNKYEEQILNESNLLKNELSHPEGDYEPILLTGFKKFINPFKTFDYSNLQQEEFHKLIDILKNTSFIIKNSKCIINNEADIYKQVKWILTLYYPSCARKNKASFIKQFKAYNPDILIPELKTAIEYKYLRDKKDNIDAFIDQIKVDAAGYTGDYQYDNFVAVFYIGDAGIATPESIELAWKEKDLPNNWTLVITGEGISPRKIKPE